MTDIHSKGEDSLCSDDYEDDVFEGVFTAESKSTTTTIKKTVTKKTDMPKKSILKRRKSSRDKKSSITKFLQSD